jgi:S1-C subfamily serine protease
MTESLKVKNYGSKKVKLSWQEGALFNTSLISAKSISDLDTGWTGTGFFVLWRAAHGDRLFLISNKHVIENSPDIEYEISLHRKSRDRTGLPLNLGGNELWVDTQNSIRHKLSLKNRYFEHSSQDVDLACVCCTELLNQRDVVLVPFSQARILDWARSQLYPSQPVMFVGYPDGAHDTMHMLPIARTGTLASMPHLSFDGDANFLIDAQVWPGSSGSPVFVKGDDESGPNAFSLIGVLHSSRLKQGAPQTFIGLGYAVRSSEVLILLEDAVKADVCGTQI